MSAGTENKPANINHEEFGYLSLPKEIDANAYRQEGFKDKFIRKTSENPFVPIGLAVTTFALTYGLWQLRTGDTVMSQKMMRLRVGAQGFTVAAILGGVLYQSVREKK